MNCNMGVGCETAGACFAKAHDQPERCGALRRELTVNVIQVDDKHAWYRDGKTWSLRDADGSLVRGATPHERRLIAACLAAVSEQLVPFQAAGEVILQRVRPEDSPLRKVFTGEIVYLPS